MSTSQPTRCAICGADMDASVERCWLCEQDPHQAAALPPVNWLRFLRTTLAAVLILALMVLCFWLYRTLAGLYAIDAKWELPALLTTILSMLAVPATARAWWYCRAWRIAGEPLTFSQRSLSFLGSLITVGLIGGVALAAFAATCAVVFLSILVVSYEPVLLKADRLGTEYFRDEIIEPLAFGVGAMAAIFAAVPLIRRLWTDQMRQCRITGRPPLARQRLRAFLHSLLIACCMLTAAGFPAIPPLPLVIGYNPMGEDIAKESLAPFLAALLPALVMGGGWLGYWFSRRDLKTAARLTAGCVGIWLAVIITWRLVGPPAMIAGWASMASFVGWHYVFPLLWGGGAMLLWTNRTKIASWLSALPFTQLFASKKR